MSPFSPEPTEPKGPTPHRNYLDLKKLFEERPEVFMDDLDFVKRAIDAAETDMILNDGRAISPNTATDIQRYLKQYAKK